MPGMGIATLFVVFVFLAVFAGLFISIVVSFGLIPLNYYIRKTPKERRSGIRKKILIMCSIWIGLTSIIIGLGTLGGGVLLAAGGGPGPLEDAHDLVSLPSEAKVTQVEYGCWAGDFFVEFRLPTTKMPKEWLEHLWELNKSKQKDFHDYKFRQDENSIGIYCFGIAHMSITYDPDTGIYRFEHYFEN